MSGSTIIMSPDMSGVIIPGMSGASMSSQRSVWVLYTLPGEHSTGSGVPGGLFVFPTTRHWPSTGL